MAEATDALHSAINHWHMGAVSGAHDQATVRTSMRSLAANIDAASPATVSASDRTRLRGKLEQMIHAAGDPAKLADLSKTVDSSVSVFA